MLVRDFRLFSRRPLPGGVPVGDGWEVRWRGTAIMGVVNVTPDSFSDGGDHLEAGAAVAHAVALYSDGALVVDVGGESTRPGAVPVDTDTELARVLPVVTALRRLAPVLVSVDTRRPEVARQAVAAGADLVNDVSGLRDPEMTRVCADLGVPVVIGHMQGDPATMQRHPHYQDVVAEVGRHLRDRAEHALAAGVPCVLVDPGIGFGKSTEHNLALLRSLDKLGPHPIMVGASRKGLVHQLADVPDPKDRGPGTLALHVWAALHGAAVVRAHDVAQHRQALAVVTALVDT